MKQIVTFGKRVAIAAVIVVAVGFAWAFIGSGNQSPAQLGAGAATIVRGIADAVVALFTFGNAFGGGVQ